MAATTRRAPSGGPVSDRRSSRSRDTGHNPPEPMVFPDLETSRVFDRERRRHALRRIATRLRQEPDDVHEMLPFEEVVAALGRRTQRDTGVQDVPLDAIVGTVDRRPGEFDREFRPASKRLRERWQRVAAARHAGTELPPIEVYRVGDLYFVEDGHHRVSVARSLGDRTIRARVREVDTRIGADPSLRPSEIPLKHHERIFFERVPLPRELRGEIQLDDVHLYGALAEGVEAWGFRVMQECQCFMSRDAVALRWFEEDYTPVVASLREGGLILPGQSETEAYIDVISRRYELMRTHEWSGDILSRITEER
jgi:hypothetical protein